MTTMITSRRNKPLAILAEWNGNLFVREIGLTHDVIPIQTDVISLTN